MSEQNVFEKQGITFSIAEEKEFEEIFSFLSENYIPEETILKASKLLSTEGVFGNKIKNELVDLLFKTPLKKRFSIIAKDKTGKIIGTRLGDVISFDNIEPDPNYRWMYRLPFGTPKVFYNLGLVQKFLDQIPFGCDHYRSQMKDNGYNNFYKGYSLCVSKKFRGNSLGKELIVRSMDVAKESGCGNMIVLCTGIYTKKIYEDLNFIKVAELEYKNFKKGSAIFSNTEPHVSAIVYVYDFEAEQK